MFHLRTAIVLLVPIACASLVACRASVGEDVRVTGEAEPAGASSDPSDPSPTSSPSPSDRMLVPSPPPPADEPTGGAASEDAPPDADAGTAAKFSCASQTMASAAPSTTCLPMTAVTLTGGTFTAGTYYLTQWSDAKATCTSTTSPQQGTMTIEDFDGRTFMRWTIGRDGRIRSGIDLLDKEEDATTIARAPVCLKVLVRPRKVASYRASAYQIVFEDEDGQQTWTRPQKAEPPTLPTEPVLTR